MPGEVTSEAKQYRVLCWLDRVWHAHAKLLYIRDKLEELDAEGDGVKSARFRKDGVRVTYTPDKIGAMIAAREETREALSEELEHLEGLVRDARRVLARAWDDNPGVADPAFSYVLAVYGDDMHPADAARECGATKWEARRYPRQVAALVYDSDPARFPETMEERNAERPYGYWAFANGR